MKRTLLMLTAAVALAAGLAHADDRDNDRDDSGRLDHVWVIMMENHGYNQIIGNPYAPFTNAEAKYANLATNYFAVGHPSLTNYLETVGGSNFGVRDDNSPDWHNANCKPNIATGAVSLESTSTAICPIYGVGTDAATPRSTPLTRRRDRPR
jgi:phosphatidylinositol-3-phosphatase